MLLLQTLVLALALLVGAQPTAALTLRECKAHCGATIAASCANLRPAKARKCRSKIWKSCKKGRLQCSSVTSTTLAGVGSSTTTFPGTPTSTTSTTTPRLTTTTTPRPTTTTTTLPAVADYEGYYEFSGQIVSGTCGFIGVDPLLFATLHISNSFGTTIVGTIDEDEGSTFFYEDVTGTATFPSWTTLTNSSCAVENVSGTRCGFVWTQMTGIPNYTFESPPYEVPGAMEKRWDNPTCTVRWEGIWTK